MCNPLFGGRAAFARMGKLPTWAAVTLAHLMIIAVAVYEFRWARHKEYFNSPLSLPPLELLHEVVMHAMRCGAMYHACKDGHMACVILVSLMMIGIELEINFMGDTCHFESVWMVESCSDFFRSFSLYAVFPYTAVIAARRALPLASRPFAVVLFGCWSYVAWEICNNGCGWIHIQRFSRPNWAGHDLLGGGIENYFWGAFSFEAAIWLDTNTNRVGRYLRLPLRLFLSMWTLLYWLYSGYHLRFVLLALLAVIELTGLFQTGFWFVALAGCPIRSLIDWRNWYAFGGQDCVLQKWARLLAPYVAEDHPRFKVNLAVFSVCFVVVLAAGRRGGAARPQGRHDRVLVVLVVFWQVYAFVMLALAWHGARIPCPDHWAGCRRPGFHDWTDEWYVQHLGWVALGGLFVIPFHYVCLWRPPLDEAEMKKVA